MAATSFPAVFDMRRLRVRSLYSITGVAARTRRILHESGYSGDGLRHPDHTQCVRGSGSARSMASYKILISNDRYGHRRKGTAVPTALSAGRPAGGAASFL